MNMELLGVDCDCLIFFTSVRLQTKNIYGAMLYLYVHIINVFSDNTCWFIQFVDKTIIFIEV